MGDFDFLSFPSQEETPPKPKENIELPDPRDIQRRMEPARVAGEHFNLGQEYNQKSGRPVSLLDNESKERYINQQFASKERARLGMETPSAALKVGISETPIQDVLRSAGVDNHFDQASIQVSQALKAAGVDVSGILGMGKRVHFGTMYLKMASVMGEQNALVELYKMTHRPEPPPNVQTQQHSDLGLGYSTPDMNDYLAKSRSDEDFIKRQADQAFYRLQEMPETKSFGSVLLFFLTSLIVGPKNAAVLFGQAHDNGTLQKEVDFHERRLQSAMRRTDLATRLVEQARTQNAAMRQREASHQDQMAMELERLDLSKKSFELKVNTALLNAQDEGQKSTIQNASKAFQETMAESRLISGRIYGLEKIAYAPYGVDEGAKQSALHQIAELNKKAVALQDRRDSLAAYLDKLRRFDTGKAEK